MDLTAFYKELKTEYVFALLAIITVVLATMFLGYCIFRNKNLKMRMKWFCSFLLLAVLVFCGYHLVPNAVLMKTDLDQKSVVYYEGKIEIVEARYTGWKPTGNVTIRMDGKEYHLTYTRNDQFFTAFEEGEYIGEIVYLRNTKDVMFFKATPI